MKRILLVTLALCFCTVYAAHDISVIPKPVRLTQGNGCFILKDRVVLCYSDTECSRLSDVVEQFVSDIKISTGIKLKKCRYKKENILGIEVDRCNKKGDAHIILKQDKTLDNEGYKLTVKEKIITISASAPAGFFYAFQTLKQLMPRNVMACKPVRAITEWSIPVVDIIDAPRFSWRGFMLDEGRHFYGKEEVKKIIDIMSAYKMNRFHWHLTEDQGWRIEIKKYPKLTDVGAWRNSRVLAWGEVKPDSIHYGGFYTRKDIAEVVEYAKKRFVEIVPEVDIPGHSQAAVASYPEFLSCDPDNKHDVWLWQGVSSDVMNVANPKAVQFAKDVIDELTDMFPFGYIHLGGDECPTAKWERNAECREQLESIGTDNFRDLQIHFYKQLKEHIAGKPVDKQRKLIFWNEVLHGNTEVLGNDIVIMAWIGADGAAKDAATRGMNTILTPQIPYYINRRQSELPTEPRSQGHGKETLEAVYSYAPMKDIPSELHSRYMGVQANFWTEWVETADVVQYLMLPRLAAVAEAGWTPQENRSFDDFLRRIQAEAEYYRFMGVDYGKHFFKQKE